MVIKKNSLPVPNLTFINFFEQGYLNKRPATKQGKKLSQVRQQDYILCIGICFKAGLQNLLLTKFLSYHK